MSTMTHKRLSAAFVKAGCEVTSIPRHDGKPSTRWMAKNPKTGASVEWSTQPRFVAATSTWDEACPVTSHVTARHPDTDAMTDLFMDSYYHTIAAAVAAIA